MADHLGDGGLVADDIGALRVRGDRIDRIDPVRDFTGVEGLVLTQAEHTGFVKRSAVGAVDGFNHGLTGLHGAPGRRGDGHIG